MFVSSFYKINPYLPFLFVLVLVTISIICVMFLPSMFLDNYNFVIKASRFNSIKIDTRRTFLFLNFFDSYDCAYYNDRSELIQYEVNRLAQFLRFFGVKVIFWINNSINSDRSVYDECLYDHTVSENFNVHRGLLYSSKDDIFVSSVKDLIDLAKFYNIRHIFAAGMKADSWIPNLFYTLKNNMIIPIYISDLSDVVFSRKLQMPYVSSHVQAIENFNKVLYRNNYILLNHYTIIDRHITEKPNNINYDGNVNTAYYFGIDFFNY